MKKSQKPPEVKRINFEEDHFEANGNVYWIQDSLSVNRYMVYEEMVPQLTFNTTFLGLSKTLNEIYKAVTTGNDILKALRLSGELAYNQLVALKNFDDNEPPMVLKFCTLFINRTDENIKVYDENLAKEKINDWTEEGIHMEDFFFLAGRSIKGYRTAYRSVFQDQANEERSVRNQIQEIDTTISDIT